MKSKIKCINKFSLIIFYYILNVFNKEIFFLILWKIIITSFWIGIWLIIHEKSKFLTKYNLINRWKLNFKT